MKLRNNHGTVETSGLADSTNFSIKVNGKAFRILLDGLYSDKVGAVIRELSTNAYDAHLAIGKGEVPFEVTLPTQFNPIFSVRDFGVSMSHEQLMRLITTVFESSKDNANNQVGAFGLGSKSPFSLVDTYTIIAWKNGEKRTYSAFFNTDGVPSLALLGTEPTTEPQGVEFSMAVNARDVNAFRDRAAGILRWFPTIPKVHNSPTKIELDVPVSSGKGWALYTRGSMVGAYARQGCVVYPIKASSIQGVTPLQAALLSSPLVIDFTIGDLDVAASREALGYDEATCANILARINTVADEVQKTMGKAIHDAPTLWEAGKARLALRSSSLPNAIITALEATKWQGKTECGDLRVAQTLAKTLDQMPVMYTWDRWRVNRSDKAVYLDGHAIRDAATFQIAYGVDNLKLFFTLEDARPTHEGRRIRSLLKDGATVYNCILFVIKTEAEKDEILKALGDAPDSGWTKDIELPVTAANPNTKSRLRGTTKPTEIKAYRVVFDHSKTLSKQTLGKEEVVQLDGDAYYIITHSGEAHYQNAVGKEKWVSLPHIFAALNALQNQKCFNKTWPVYAISTTYEKRVQAYGKWTSFFKPIEVATSTIWSEVEEEYYKNNFAQLVQRDGWCNAIMRSTTLRHVLTQRGTGSLFLLQTEMEKRKLIGAPNLELRSDASLKVRELFNLIDVDGNAYNLEKTARDVALSRLEYISFHRLLKNTSETYPLAAEIVGQYGRNTGSSGYVPLEKNLMDYIEAIDLLREKRRQSENSTLQSLAKDAA